MTARARRIRLRQTAAVLAAAAAGAESARLTHGTDWYAFGSTATWSAVLGLMAGAALLVAGVVLLGSDSSRTPGALLAVAAVAWWMTAWQTPAAPVWIFLLGRILNAGWPVLVAHALLSTYGRPGRKEWVLLASAYAATIGLDVVAAVTLDPAASGCVDCPGNPVLLADLPQVAAGLERASVLAGPVWAVLLAAALTARLIGSTFAQRRITLPATIAGLLIMASVAAGYLRATARGLSEADDVVGWTFQSVLLLLLALATRWPAVSLALTRQRLARLVVQASAAPIGDLGRVLGATLRDPTVRLLYPRDGESHLIDAGGQPAQARAELTPLTRGSEVVAYLDHGTPLLDHEGAVIAHVARLSLDHERLNAECAAQLRELRASRVRIVAAADRERRRLERDLHDGAQQRLVSLALGIQLAELTAVPAEGSRQSVLLTEAATEMTAAQAQLRAIARGLYPRELADEGLESALETFAESDPTPVDLDCEVPERLPQAVESAAYFTVALCLASPRYESGAARTIRVWMEGPWLHLDLAGGRTDDLTAAEDRVGALGGTVERIGAGSIRVVLPCE